MDALPRASTHGAQLSAAQCRDGCGPIVHPVGDPIGLPVGDPPKQPPLRSADRAGHRVEARIRWLPRLDYKCAVFMGFAARHEVDSDPADSSESGHDRPPDGSHDRTAAGDRRDRWHETASDATTLPHTAQIDASRSRECRRGRSGNSSGSNMYQPGTLPDERERPCFSAPPPPSRSRLGGLAARRRRPRRGRRPDEAEVLDRWGDDVRTTRRVRPRPGRRARRRPSSRRRGGSTPRAAGSRASPSAARCRSR
jgi:hypothetical protein